MRPLEPLASLLERAFARVGGGLHYSHKFLPVSEAGVGSERISMLGYAHGGARWGSARADRDAGAQDPAYRSGVNVFLGYQYDRYYPMVAICSLTHQTTS